MDAQPQFFVMQRYAISSPLVAIRLCPSETDKGGVMSSLPSEAIVETRGPSDLGKGMVEVSWQHQRYAVFELDLETRYAGADRRSCGRYEFGLIPSGCLRSQIGTSHCHLPFMTFPSGVSFASRWAAASRPSLCPPTVNFLVSLVQWIS